MILAFIRLKLLWIFSQEREWNRKMLHFMDDTMSILLIILVLQVSNFEMKFTTRCANIFMSVIQLK